MHGRTPQDRIERAVGKELAALRRRAAKALRAHSDPLVATACAEIDRAGTAGGFPRQELQRLERDATGMLKAELGRWIGEHEELERRLRWLLDPELTRTELSRLDPLRDSDQIWCFVQYDFRPEFLHSTWGNATKRVVQMESATLFLHATGRAEGKPIVRADETLCFFHYFFEWGESSYHGQKSIESINLMHGRYAIHNDAMKYVLLNSAFTVLDGLAVVGHRPPSEVERLGYFHAYIKLGKAMGIAELSHSWPEMYGWFSDRCRSWARPSPRKLRMWQSIHDNFDRALGIPPLLGKLRQLPEIYAMDETYRAALGLEARPPLEVAAFRGLIRLIARARARLPREPWILSLQNFHSFPKGVNVEELGPKERSERLPQACPFTGQELGPVYTWDEVKKHNRPDDLWVVFGGHVYDVSSFAKHHPGGLSILRKGAGQDLTEAFEAAGHSELARVFTRNFRIGRIASARSRIAANGAAALSR